MEGECVCCPSATWLNRGLNNSNNVLLMPFSTVPAFVEFYIYFYKRL